MTEEKKVEEVEGSGQEEEKPKMTLTEMEEEISKVAATTVIVPTANGGLRVAPECVLSFDILQNARLITRI